MPGPRRRKRRVLDPDPPPLTLPDTLSEHWFAEWFQYGYELLCGLLANHARFQDYLAAHPDDEQNALD